MPFVVLSAPLTIGLAAGGPQVADLGRVALAMLLTAVQILVLSPLITGALTIAVSERYLDRPANVLLAYRRVLRSAWPLVGTMAIVTIPFFILALGAVLALVVGLSVTLAVSTGALEPMQVAGLSVGLSVPFIALLFVAHQAWFGVLPAAVVLERQGFAALLRSIRLVRGRFWYTARLVAVLTLMVLLATLFARLPTQLLAGTAGLGRQLAPVVLGTIAMNLAMLLTDPVRMVGMTLIYYDLRVRGEGYDLALLAADLESGRRNNTVTSP